MSPEYEQTSLLPPTEEPQRTRKKDPCWEALVQATACNPESFSFDRGRLNAALKAIRAAATNDGLSEDEIAAEIPRRALAYREHPTFRECALTPTALAAHWRRVMVEPISAAPAAGKRQQALEQARLMA